MTLRLHLTALALGALFLGACGSDDSEGSSGGAGGTGATGGAAGQAGSGGSSGAGAGGVLGLAPGEVAEVTLDKGAASLRLATPDGTEQYLVVLASELLEPSSSGHDYSLSSGSVTTASPAEVLSGCSLTSDKWKGIALPPETPPSGAGPAVGAEKSLDVGLPTGKETIQVKAIAVGKSAIVWADITAAHPAVMDATFAQQFLDDFENIILPRARGVFGVESDLDQDGHIGLVFSPLTYQTAVAFFTSCDLKPSMGCPGSNGGEYLYLSPPNAIAPPYNTPNAIKEILAHELEHMVHFNRKVLKNGIGGSNESMYMHEGAGAFSQDVLGYQSGNLYVTMAGLDHIGEYSVAETLVDNVKYGIAAGHCYEQIVPPAKCNRDGALRGGSYLFVRWFYDRAGGDSVDATGITSKGGPALLRAVLDAPGSISDELALQTGSTLEALAMDFWTTLAVSNREDAGGVAPKNPCFAYLPTVVDPVTTKQRGANVFASFHGQQMQGPKVQPLAEADGLLRAGGAEFISVDAVSGQAELGVTLSADEAAKPRVRVARLR